MYFTRPQAAGPTVPTLVRAAVVAALALPVQLPAGVASASARAKGATAA
jgi:hypothetical protein